MQLKTCVPFLCLAAGACLAAAEPNPMRTLETAPLRFEPASHASAAKFVARGARFHFEFTPQQAILRAGKRDLRLRFDGANPAAQIQAAQLLPSTTNVYFGNDPAQWRRAIPNYARLDVPGLYRGIDLVYYGNGRELEYDLTVNPGADPGRIRLHLDGEGIHLNRQGDLVAGFIEKHPVAYQ